MRFPNRPVTASRTAATALRVPRTSTSGGRRLLHDPPKQGGAMPEMIRPLQQRRDDGMKELRRKAEEGNKSAQRDLRTRCRTGMLVPYWER